MALESGGALMRNDDHSQGVSRPQDDEAPKPKHQPRNQKQQDEEAPSGYYIFILLIAVLIIYYFWPSAEIQI